MGFERTRNIILEFADPDLEGLEITTKSASAGTVMQYVNVWDAIEGGEPKEKVEATAHMVRMFAGCPPTCDWSHVDRGGNHYVSMIKTWNLERDGQPVPMNYEGFMGEDMEFVMSVVRAWMDGQVGETEELGKGSNDGGQSEEPLIPMTTL